MPNKPKQNELQPLPPAMNKNQGFSFIPIFGGSFPIEDFIQEVRNAQKLGACTDTVTLKVVSRNCKAVFLTLSKTKGSKLLTHIPTFCFPPYQ